MSSKQQRQAERDRETAARAEFYRRHPELVAVHAALKASPRSHGNIPVMAKPKAAPSAAAPNAKQPKQAAKPLTPPTTRERAVAAGAATAPSTLRIAGTRPHRPWRTTGPVGKVTVTRVPQQRSATG